MRTSYATGEQTTFKNVSLGPKSKTENLEWAVGDILFIRLGHIPDQRKWYIDATINDRIVRSDPEQPVSDGYLFTVKGDGILFPKAELVYSLGYWKILDITPALAGNKFYDTDLFCEKVS